MNALQRAYERLRLTSPWVPRWFHDEMMRRRDEHVSLLTSMLQDSNEAHIGLLRLLHARELAVDRSVAVTKNAPALTPIFTNEHAAFLHRLWQDQTDPVILDGLTEILGLIDALLPEKPTL